MSATPKHTPTNEAGQQEPERHTCDESPTPAYTFEARQAKQFATRKEAAAAAVSIRWNRGDVLEVWIMGFRLWTVADDHCRMLTPAGLAALVAEVEREHRSNFGAARAALAKAEGR